MMTKKEHDAAEVIKAKIVALNSKKSGLEAERDRIAKQLKAQQALLNSKLAEISAVVREIELLEYILEEKFV